MPTYAREIAFTPEDPERLAVRPTHREYVRELFEAGTIRMSGPFAGDDGALLIYRADSLDAARELAAADPYAVAGVVTEVSLREWTTIFPGE